MWRTFIIIVVVKLFEDYRRYDIIFKNSSDKHSDSAEKKEG